MEICEKIDHNTRENMRRTEADLPGADGIAIGVGAGFFTGLWLGLELNNDLW